MDILATLKAHPKESAGVILAGVVGAVVLSGKLTGKGSTANTGNGDPNSAYVIPMDQPPTFNFNLPDYSKSPNMTPVAPTQPGTTPVTPTPARGTVGSKNGVQVPNEIISKKSCPRYYHFGLNKSGQWECQRIGHGAKPLINSPYKT
jgi:hypothetical protein